MLRVLQEREGQLREKQRVHTPHIEFSIDCSFYGPEEDHYLTEILLIAHNKGLVQHKFTNILLRVRGIESGHPLSYWQGSESRLEFPTELLDDVPVIPRGYNYFFVEPGVKQVFTYITRIPSSTKYILAHAEFQYDQFTPHTTERVFQVRTQEY